MSAETQTWSTRRTLAALGVAAVIAGLGGAAIYAATAGSSAMGPGRHGPGPWGGDRGPGAPDGASPASALHGEFVVPDGAGGYVTDLTQTGVLTAVSDASITAKSADGFTQTYTISADNRRVPLAVNDTVTIHGKLVDGKPTATAVTEGSDGGPGGPPAAPHTP